MKLKRILSLALSGVLAVSMLTACGGFGGGAGGVSVSDRSPAVRVALNDRLDDIGQATVNFDGNRSLASATRTVARGLTKGDASKALDNTTGAVVAEQETIAQIMVRYIDYDVWSTLGGPHSPKKGAGDKTFVTLILFDGKLSADGVGRAVADKVKTWNLEAVNTDKDSTFTLEPHAEAYLVTIPGETSGEGEDAKTEPDTTVWVVGLMLEQTERSNG